MLDERITVGLNSLIIIMRFNETLASEGGIGYEREKVRE